jgi:hypothetical protein
MTGVSFEMPALTVTVYATSEMKVPVYMPDRSVCFIKCMPSVKDGTYMSNMKSRAAAAPNTFHIPSTHVFLSNDYQKSSILTFPSMMVRISAPGNQIMNPHKDAELMAKDPCIYQHMVTAIFAFDDVMQALIGNNKMMMEQRTDEDGQQYVICINLDTNSASIQQLLVNSRRVLAEHIQKIRNMHGHSVMKVADAIALANKGRLDRSSEETEAFKCLCPQGELAEWFLTDTRLFKSMQLDMAQSNYMRTAAVQSNPDLQALFFVLICGGMMSEITQRHNGNLTSQDSVINALNLWMRQGRSEILDEFIRNLQRHNAVATAYLNDPFFGSVNGKLEIMEKAGEDQNTCGGPQVEALLNKLLFNLTLWLGDCEDLTAFMLAILDLLKFKRVDFISVIQKSIRNIPVYFQNQAAASDYTTHDTNLQTMAIKIWESYQPDAYAAYPTRVQSVQQLISLMHTQSSMQAVTEISMTSILASAPSIDQNTIQKENLRNINLSLKQYTKTWMAALDPKVPGPSIQGHAIGMRMQLQPVAVLPNGVSVQMFAEMPTIIESTALAQALPKDTPNDKMKVNYGTATGMRMKLQEKIDNLGVPISLTLAVNLESTLCTSEIQHELEKELQKNTGACKVTAYSNQTYEIGGQPNTSPFYRTAISTTGALLSVHLESGCVVPGLTLEQGFEGVKHIVLKAEMKPPERRALEVLGNVAADMGLSLGDMVTNKMFPELVPLSARVPLTAVEQNGGVTLVPVSPVDLEASANTTGVTIKTLFADTKTAAPPGTLEEFAKGVGSAMTRVFHPNAQLQLGAFMGSVIIESPL